MMLRKRVVVNFDVIAWFTHNAKLRLIANCRLRDHSRITHYPFTQSLQKLPLPEKDREDYRNKTKTQHFYRLALNRLKTQSKRRKSILYRSDLLPPFPTTTYSPPLLKSQHLFFSVLITVPGYYYPYRKEFDSRSEAVPLRITVTSSVTGLYFLIAPLGVPR